MIFRVIDVREKVLRIIEERKLELEKKIKEATNGKVVLFRKRKRR